MVMHLLLCGVMAKKEVAILQFLQNSGSDFVQVGWVTQLVVDKQVHQHYIATQLLQCLKFHALFSDVDIVGLVSSHPAACNTLAKFAGKLLLSPLYLDIETNNMKLLISNMLIWALFVNMLVGFWAPHPSAI
jgi:hypothetical protein